MSRVPDILGAFGAGAISAGVFLVAGLGAALIVGGVLAVVACILLAATEG
jgi:hypothetical protein